MPYSHLTAATVMTLGVCQGRSSIASFSILTSVSRGPSAIAEFLVYLVVNWQIFTINKDKVEFSQKAVWDKCTIPHWSLN